MPVLIWQVGLQAYLLWEQAGKPDGANFSDDARRQLQQQVQSGKSVQDIERALKGPSDQKAPEQHQPAKVDFYSYYAVADKSELAQTTSLLINTTALLVIQASTVPTEASPQVVSTLSGIWGQ